MVLRFVGNAFVAFVEDAWGLVVRRDRGRVVMPESISNQKASRLLDWKRQKCCLSLLLLRDGSLAEIISNSFRLVTVGAILVSLIELLDSLLGSLNVLRLLLAVLFTKKKPWLCF